MIKIHSKLDITPEMKIAIKTLLSNLAEFDIEVEIKKATKKRSLDANAYFHVLVGKLADALGTSKPYMKNLLLSKYGQLEYDDDKLVTLIVRDDLEMWEREEIHLRPTDKVKTLDDKRVYRVHLVVRGSHTYNSAEMAKLIDGTVQDCKDADIETETPDMIKGMLERWGVKHG
ncbi:hypothetical protein M2149_000816 [Lachnospiraceae bacterium PFB1-21]